MSRSGSDGWEVQESIVQAEALEEGNDSPLIMVFLPRKHHNEYPEQLTGVLAATEIPPERQHQRHPKEVRQKPILK